MRTETQTNVVVSISYQNEEAKLLSKVKSKTASVRYSPYPQSEEGSGESGAQTVSAWRTATMLSAMDTMMDSFRSFIEMFQGSDETATEVLWKVENFSFCHLQKGEKITSPVFKLGEKYYFFELYPKGEGHDNLMDIHLRNPPYHKPKLLFFSIASARDIGLDAVWKTEMRKEDTITASLSVKNSKRLRENPDMLTSGDTLTIRCVVQGYIEPKTIPVPLGMGIVTLPTKSYSEPRNILLCSRFIVKKFCTALQFKNFSDNPYKNRKEDIPCMKTPNNSEDSFKTYLAFFPNINKVEVHIVPRRITHSNFLTCKLLVIDTDGIPLNLLKKGHLLTEKSAAEWVSSHAVNVANFLDNKELYLSNDTLTLMVELTQTHQICSEEVRYSPKTLVSKDSTLIPGGLVSDLQLLFDDKTSCDVHLKIGSESVSVHKSILRARSSVFKAMMDHDTVEKATNSVVIPDMDLETLQHMVKFMYTDTVKDLNWSNAIHLYYAADKYDIGLLKKRCAEYLAENINQSNIYEVLVLSDMHDDALLKKCARNFIFTQKSTLVNSEEWKTIESNYPNLALDILRELYCKAVVPKVEDSDSKGVVKNSDKTGRS